MRFSGKTVLVTGAGTGIGRSIVKRLAKEGATLAVSDLDADTAKDTLDSIRGISPNSRAYCIDVRDEDNITDVKEKILGDFKKLDIVVNNAGVSSMAPLTELTGEDWDFNMNVNAKGAWLVLKHFAPEFIKRKNGRFVVIASMASKLGAPFLAHYSASKFAVLGLVQAAAKEFAPHNITVNAVCPGFVNTGMQDREIVWEAKLRNIADPEDIRKEYIGMTPLGRLCEPDDVANVVSFLVSDDSSFMTGQALNVTGGICVH